MTERARGGHSLSVRSAHAGPDASSTEPASPEGVARAAEFERIYDEHVDFVWRSLRRLGVADASVEDAVQDVFVVVHRRLAEFEGRSSMRTWLFGILYRVASDQRRHTRRKGELAQLSSALRDGAALPDESLETAESLRALDQALARLDPERRAVFVMAEIEGMTAPEIAEVLGVKLNTVYSRLRVARSELDLAIGRAQEEER